MNHADVTTFRQIVPKRSYTPSRTLSSFASSAFLSLCSGLAPQARPLNSSFLFRLPHSAPWLRNAVAVFFCFLRRAVSFLLFSLLYACLATIPSSFRVKTFFRILPLKNRERTVILEHSSCVRQGFDLTFFFTENRKGYVGLCLEG